MTSTWVALGCNGIRDYQFTVPLTALLWRDRIGFQPVVLRCDEWMATGRGQAAVRALEHHDIPQAILNPLEGYESHTLAQNCREFASCLPIPDDEWIMPADADLWPIMRSFYERHLKPGVRGALYYSNGDHYQTYPTCHVTLRARDWRAMGYGPMNANVTRQVHDAVTEWLKTYRSRWPWDDRNFAVWMSDQAMVTDRLRAAPFHDELLRVERSGHPPQDRIDRLHWRDLRADDVDAHILRAPDEDHVWPKLFDLFTRLLPQHSAWAAQYREEYRRGY